MGIGGEKSGKFVLATMTTNYDESQIIITIWMPTEFAQPSYIQNMS